MDAPLREMQGTMLLQGRHWLHALMSSVSRGPLDLRVIVAAGGTVVQAV
jgi:hypothetical protein